MQNLTDEEKNVTQCDLCLHSSVFESLILPYVLISLLANGRVLWLMISSPAFWTGKMEVCAFHLVLTEMLFGFLLPAFWTTRHFVDYEVADKLTKLINIMFTVRIQFQNCVCIERYVAVLRPVLYCRYKPVRYRMSLCCLLWVQAILVCILQMFLCGEHQESLSISRAFFLLCLIVNTFCSLSVLKALKQPSPGKGEREGSDVIKKKAFNIVLLYQVTAFVSYLPLATMLFLVHKIERSTLCVLLPMSYSVMVWLGIIHPLLYLHRAGKSLVRNGVCVNCVQV